MMKQDFPVFMYLGKEELQEKFIYHVSIKTELMQA